MVAVGGSSRKIGSHGVDQFVLNLERVRGPGGPSTELGIGQPRTRQTQLVLQYIQTLSVRERQHRDVAARSAHRCDTGTAEDPGGKTCEPVNELGAHLVKTYYCDGFEKVVETCLVPVVIAGGKKTPEKEALQLAHNAIARGAVGVDMGRNIFQSDNPVGMIQAVRAIVHENAAVDKAYALYKKA